MDTATSTNSSGTSNYDSKFFAPIDLFEEAPSAPNTSCPFDDTILSNHHDMLTCPSSGSQHPLDPTPRNPFYLQNNSNQTPVIHNHFMDSCHLPSSPLDLNPLDHSYSQSVLVPFPGHLEDFYGSCTQSSPSSYLQYLQQSPKSSNKLHHPHPSHYILQSSSSTKAKADTTPLDILDPPSSVYNNNNNPMFSADNTSNNKHLSMSAASSLDLSHLAMDPPCPSSVEYMDTSKPSWMLDSLDNTYLTATLDHSLDFYDNSPNNENLFYLGHSSYLSQPDMASSMSSNSLPTSSSCQHESNDLSSTCLPRGYVNMSDVNSFVAETDSIKHTTSFPHLSISPSKCSNGLNGGGGPVDELQSLLGDISPATPSNNNSSSFLSHAFVVPSYLNPPSAYSYSDSNESMDDDLSDSDTTTSTQSWMVPFPQDPFFSWRDNPSGASNFYPLGLTSSMSTPVVGAGHNHPYPRHSHPFPQYHQQQNNNMSFTTGDTINDMVTNKREKPNNKRRTKQQQQQQQQGQPGKARRSTSGMIHPGGRKKSSISSVTKRKELRRRESEPHSLSAISAFPSSSSGKSFPSKGSASSNITSFSPARLSVSESISSFLSRQRLSDDEEEEDTELNEGDEEEEEDDSDQGVYLPHQYQGRLSNRNDNPFSQKHHHHHHQQHDQHKDLNTKVGLQYHSSCSGEMGGPPTSHPKKGRNVDKACNHCKRSHLRCDNMRPCRRCIATGKSGCKDVEHKPRGRPRLHNT
ncbi:hypothetical protein BC941DRAFT_417749 [Chlamydoabsidia padenii]|nr:hypothetical protein BC941DRAFT_417749 [Chlamydoabsidia padenii]